MLLFLVVVMGLVVVPSAGADAADYTVRVTYQGSEDLHSVDVLLFDTDRACNTLTPSPTGPPSPDTAWTSLEILPDAEGNFPDRLLNIPTEVELHYAVARGEPTDGPGSGAGYFSTFGCVDEIADPSSGVPVLIEIEMTDINPSENTPPIADAGEDQTVEWVDGGVSVTLDGTTSEDPDGDTLTYTWTGGFSEGTASGLQPTVTFTTLGDFTVTLEVEDEDGGTDTDTATISVVDTTPPEVRSALEPSLKTPAWGVFEVIAECDDTCDDNPLTEATINGVNVYDGQEIVLFRHPFLTLVERTEYFLIVVGQEFELKVNCTDSSGNTSTSSVSADL
jgi:hypothetical protein